MFVCFLLIFFCSFAFHLLTVSEFWFGLVWVFILMRVCHSNMELCVPVPVGVVALAPPHVCTGDIATWFLLAQGPMVDAPPPLAPIRVHQVTQNLLTFEPPGPPYVKGWPPTVTLHAVTLD